MKPYIDNMMIIYNSDGKLLFAYILIRFIAIENKGSDVT